MTFFLPSFFQKRILRYALSQLDLLDTDALDLDKLEIAWGRKSTIELHDVQIQIDKISDLLKLPDFLEITTAKLSILKLTIPADLYSSGIFIEVRGVELKVKVQEVQVRRGERSTDAKDLRKHNVHPKTAVPGTPRNGQSQVHDPGGTRKMESDENRLIEGDEPSLPSTVDLAQSFLQAEPRENRHQLEIAMAQSVRSDNLAGSDGESLDESVTGVGQPYSIPTFLADFLRGVGQRLMLNVQDIRVDLDLSMANATSSDFKDVDAAEFEHVTVKLQVAAINVGETSRNERNSPIGKQDNASNSETWDLRPVLLKNIRVSIFSEAYTFSKLKFATSPTPPNISTSSPSAKTWKSSTRSNVAAEGSTSFTEDMTTSIGDLRSFRSAHLASPASSGSVESATQVAEVERGNSQGDEQVGGWVDDGPQPTYYDLLRAQVVQGPICDAEEGSTSLTHPELSWPRHSMFVDRLDPLLRHSFPLLVEQHSNRIDFVPDSRSNQTHADSQSFTAARYGNLRSESTTPESHNSHSSSENLSESRIYSHEEATSMYMSAMSDQKTEVDRSRRIPGAWESSYSNTRSSTESPNSELHVTPPRAGTQSLKQTVALDLPPIDEQDDRNFTDGFTRNDRASSPSSLTGTEILDRESTKVDPKIQQLKLKDADLKEVSSGSLPSSSGSPEASREPMMVEKDILSIDNISVEIPVNNSIEDSSNTDQKSHSQRGYASESSAGPTNISSRNLQESQELYDTPLFEPNQDIPPSNPFIIGIDNVRVFTDLSLTKMLILIVTKFGPLEGPHDTDSVKVKEMSNVVSAKAPNLRVDVGTLQWSFCDIVRGQALGADALKDSNPYHSNRDSVRDVLLKMKFSTFRISISGTDKQTALKVSAANFSFGYGDEDILTFDSGLKMRESTRDVLALDEDFILTVKIHEDMIDLDLRTLPSHVVLDLQKLDETIAWFGGFSHILGFGSSMASTVTSVNAKVKTKAFHSKAREVRFKDSTPLEPVSSLPKGRQQKITTRIGGLFIEVKGTSISMNLESSAVKIVNRAEGAGLQVDRATFRGPFLNGSKIENSMQLRFSNTRIEYLATPKEVDLTRLLGLLSPSKEKYDRDDDILLDTLLRQRRKGAVVRITVDALDLDIKDSSSLKCYPSLLEDLKRFSGVTKYLPEDDRPGLLTLFLIRSFQARIAINERLGSFCVGCGNIELAHITFPTLITLGISTLAVSRDDAEDLVGTILQPEPQKSTSLPSVMARFIGNEMEPTVKIRLYRLRFEYHLTVMMAALGLEDDASTEKLISDMTSSVATFTNLTQAANSPGMHSQTPENTGKSAIASMVLAIEISLKDIVLGLNPRNSKARGLALLTDAAFRGGMPNEKQASVTFDIRKAAIMVVDDQSKVEEVKASHLQGLLDLVAFYEEAGYVVVSRLSAAHIVAQVFHHETGSEPSVEVEVKDNLLILESCADSTQTLLQIFNGMKPPAARNDRPKYRTEVVPVQDMLASFCGDAFALDQDTSPTESDGPLNFEEGDLMDDDVPQNLEFVSSFYNPDPVATSQSIADSILDDDFESLAMSYVQREIGDRNRLESFDGQSEIAPGNMPLEFRDDHFGSDVNPSVKPQKADSEGTGRIGRKSESEICPLKVRVHNIHIIWNLFDGYDWQHTRDVIGEAVADIQHKALEKLSRRDKSRGPIEVEEVEDVIGDFLFNSIYIGIPAKTDPADLTKQVSFNVDESYSETESTPTTAVSARSPSQYPQISRANKKKRPRLARSKHHKMAFELKGISAEFVVFPPGIGEIESSTDLRIDELDIFDHVPTSTWKKFATYMWDAGERETGSSMVHINLDNVRPVPSLSATEIALKVSVLPIRLHVDQDALDFLTRFFDFKDDGAPDPVSKSEVPFIQRAEINSVRVRLDFKPKRVDYAGIRSGRTNEFMNFFVLDAADMILRHVIIYGISGFDRLGKTLNDIWMPDVKRNQLPGVLAGIAPVRSLVNVGGGVRDLVIVPVREYRKDGRIVRSIQKGASAFARTTTSELMRLGAKLAIGTQTVLQGVEGALVENGPQTSSEGQNGDDDSSDSEEKQKHISLYADQPIGVVQGLRGAFADLERDFLTAKDAIIAMPGEIVESGTAGGAARAVLKGAPTVILRPAMGISKAVGQTLMGATNSLDSRNQRRMEDKYKRH